MRGEDEEIAVELLLAIQAGGIEPSRESIRGIAFLRDAKVVATPARPVIEDRFLSVGRGLA